MARTYDARVAALEHARSMLPADLHKLTDAQLEAVTAPLAPFFAVLTDEELQAIVYAHPNRSLHDVLTGRDAPWKWTEWTGWGDATRTAVCDAWGQPAPLPPTDTDT